MENDTYLIFGQDIYKIVKKISFAAGVFIAAAIINKALKLNDSKITVGLDFYEIVKNKALANL